MWPPSPSTSPSPYAAVGSGGTPIGLPTAGRTMDEVWREISTLPHHPSASRGVILQDFLSNDPPPQQQPASPPTLLTLSSLVLRQQQQHAPVSSPKKRLPAAESDRRHKRMIKNRESAARSRARKQAYTNELELEVAHLLEENARLKEKQQQLYRDAAAQHDPKGKPHHRTFSSPF